MLRFSDGVTIDTSGELRIIRREDGLYVVGDGCCIPCTDDEDADATLALMQGSKSRSEPAPGG